MQPQIKFFYRHPIFVQYKKSPINLFSLYHMKKSYIREKKKKSRGKKIIIWSKEKKI
jgi:hypothetical protein